MIEVDVEEAQANLKEYIAKAKLGEKVIFRMGPYEKFELKQIATAPRSTEPRRIGAGVGQGTIHPSFYDPLPEDILKYFEGRGDDDEGAAQK